MAQGIIAKDDNGVPLRDENNQMIRTEKAVGEISFSKNLINLNSFLVDYNALIDKYEDLMAKREKGELVKYTKKETYHVRTYPQQYPR